MSAYTIVHVLISLAAIGAGLVVAAQLLRSSLSRGWTGAYLALSVATDVTGFFFPFHGLTPGIIVGIASMVLLIFAIAALYGFRLAGGWRWIYVVSIVTTLWLNIFVLIVQAFQKIAPLHALAPKGSEPVFAVVQGVALLAFILLGYFSVRRFHAPVMP